MGWRQLPDDVQYHSNASNNYYSAVDCQHRRKNCVCLLVFGLHCEHKQLQTSLAATGDFQELHTIEEMAHRHTGPTIYTMQAPKNLRVTLIMHQGYIGPYPQPYSFSPFPS